jgi:class 3 adenylate cyclase
MIQPIIEIEERFLNLRPSFSKLGLSYGVALAMAYVLTAGLGSGLLWNVMQSENKAYVQQSIGDTTLILAIHFRTAFERFIERISEVGESQLRLTLSPFDRSRAVRSKSLAVGTTDTSPEILDVSLWKLGPPLKEDSDDSDDEESDVPRISYQPRRSYLALNSRFPNLSAELIQHLQATERLEVSMVRPAFQGHTVVSLAPSVEGFKALMLTAVPLGHGVVNEVVVSHIRMEQFQQVLSGNKMVDVALVDGSGYILAHSDENEVGKKIDVGTSSLPLFQSVQSSGLPSGQLNFKDEKGNQFYGGYSRVGIGQLVMLATVAEAEAGATLQGAKNRTIFFLIACSFLFLGLGYLTITRREEAAEEFEKRQHAYRESETEVSPVLKEPKRIVVTILHGTLRRLNQVIETSTALDSSDAINDYFTIVAMTIKEFGGIFEFHSEKSFIGIWGAPNSDGTEIWRALRCAIEIRRNLYKLNESRKVNGQKPLSFGMGIHTGLGLAARLGSAKSLKYTVAGEVVNCAAALDDLSYSAGTDLLISHEIWQQSEAKFVGDSLGETKLTPDTGLTGVYSISGYRNEQGQVVLVEPIKDSEASTSETNPSAPTAWLHPVIKTEKDLKWLVNNGSQIIGPLTPKEIALRLFAQELDFDCECWEEGTGNSAQLKDSGVFSGSDDHDANLWIFDGETVHGPVSQGFLKTALGHGAIQQSVFICEGSTVSGWKPLSRWDLDVAPAKASSDLQSPQNPLRASLAPPQPHPASIHSFKTTEHPVPTAASAPTKKAA